MNFNINNYASVKLTPEGIEKYKEHWSSVGITKEPELDENGFLKEQMWSIMQTFGPHIYLGGPNMFDTEIILHP